MSYGGQQAAAGYGGQQAAAGAGGAYGGQQPVQIAGYGAQQPVHVTINYDSSSSSSSDSESEAAKARQAEHKRRQEARRQMRLQLQAGKIARAQAEEQRRKEAAEKAKRQAERDARRRAKGTALKHNPWQLGQVVFLKASSGKNLRIMPNNEVNGSGGDGKLAEFKVSKVEGRKIQLTNAGGKTLRVINGLPDGGGNGGQLCWFIPQKKADKWCFKVANLGGYLGITQDGKAKPHGRTGTGPHGCYTVTFKPMTPWTMGRGFFLKASSGKNLRIMPNNQVNGTGGDGKLAEFKVSKVDGKKIQMTNAQGKTLRVVNGLPDGAGGGGPLCWFTPEQIDSDTWVFATASGGYLGIKQDGTAKPHAQTGKGPHGRFDVRWK